MDTKRILHLKSSIQGPKSHSVQLGHAVVDGIVKKYPGSTVEEVDLVELDIPHLQPKTLRSFFTPGQHRTEEDQANISYSDAAVEQLKQADIVVIGAPLYNFSIHSSLKAWIDHITRAGLTFGYSKEGFPIGMVTGKKVYVAMSSGGIFSEGPGKANDFVAPYLRAFLGFLGMTDITVVRAEGLKVPGVMEQAMEKAYASIEID